MDKRIIHCLGIGVLALCLLGGQLSIATAATAATAAQPEATGWYWLSSDDNYSKYFDPESVVVTKSSSTAHGQVPTEIQVWTKTAYSYGGAKETLAAYGLTKRFPDPAELSYSTAQLLIKPQYRSVQYLAENFYDAQGGVIWSKADPEPKEKEINSQQFDEAFYIAAVDQAFHQNDETERAKASDRWTTIFDVTTLEGARTHTTADTSTMRMRGDNLIFWEWQETKDSNGKVVEIKFLKMAINLNQATEKVISGKYWTAQSGWQSLDDSLDGQYRMVNKTSNEYKTITALRQYVEANYQWVHRYGLE